MELIFIHRSVLQQMATNLIYFLWCSLHINYNDSYLPTDMKGHILKYLETHTSVKRNELRTYLHSLGILTSDREMRKEIEGMIEDGCLIASTVHGYKIIKTEDELKEAVAYLKKKAFPLFHRAECLEKSFHSRTSKQTQLFVI